MTRPREGVAHQVADIVFRLSRRLRQGRPMLVEVDALSQSGRFMAEELPAVVGGDPGSRVKGLDRVPQGFDRDAKTSSVQVDTGFSLVADEARLQDRGDQRRTLLGLPDEQDPARFHQRPFPDFGQPGELSAGHAARHEVVASPRPGDGQEASQAVRTEVDEASLTVSPVAFGSRDLDAGDAEIPAQPGKLAPEKLLAMAAAGIEGHPESQ